MLAFAIGAGATFFRSDLKLPDAIHLAITSYLLLAIGLKGGAELSASSPGDVWAPALAAMAVGLAIPLWSFAIARRFGRLSIDDAAAMAAHYGSVSVVTFTATLVFLDQVGLQAEGFMPALLAMLEWPAIVVALGLAHWRSGGAKNIGETLREIFTGRSIVLLIGGMVIGLAAGKDGLNAVSPVFVTPFYGVLVIFLLEMGRVAAGHVSALKDNLRFVLGFGIGMPLLHGTMGVAIGTAVGLSVGGAAVFGVLAASASYVAAPAAVRLALPKANPGLYLGSSLGVTFPFNLLIGIPLFCEMAKWMGS